MSILGHLDAGVAFAFLIGQLYILSRIVTKCMFWAGQTAMYESFREEAAGAEEERARPRESTQ